MAETDAREQALRGGARWQYALEVYVPRAANDTGHAAWCRDTPVRFLRSIFIPQDEMCFVLVEATSRAAVVDAARRAAVAFERVLEVEIAPECPPTLEAHHASTAMSKEGRQCTGSFRLPCQCSQSSR